MVPATRPRRVDKRSAVHQRRRGIRWTALSLVHPTAGTMTMARTGLDQDSGHLGSPGASSGHPGLTPSGLEALTTHAAGRDYDQGRRTTS